MTGIKESTARRFGQFAQSPDAVDRGLVMGCAAVWLLALGVGVGAVVAMADLGDGQPGGEAPAGTGTPWLLYTVIGVSVLVIAAAVPLLVRARRTQLSNSPHGPVARAATPLSAQRALDRDAARKSGASAGRPYSSVISEEKLNRMLLRCGIAVLTTVGAAMVAVALGGYLMAVSVEDSGTPALIAFAVAGVITAGMSAIPVHYLRQLRSMLGEV